MLIMHARGGLLVCIFRKYPGHKFQALLQWWLSFYHGTTSGRIGKHLEPLSGEDTI